MKTNTPKPHQEQRGRVAAHRRNPRCSGVVARHGPDDGAEHPAAIEREPRDQVEDAQRHVHHEEPAHHHRDVNAEPLDQVARAQEQQSQQHAAHRPRERDEQLYARPRRLPRDVRGPAEHEQRDGPDPDPVPHRHQAVRQLVSDDRHEEHGAGGQGHAPSLCCRPPGTNTAEEHRQGVGE